MPEKSSAHHIKTPVVISRPEAELLLCCARTTMDADSAVRIRVLLRDDIEWSALLRQHYSTAELKDVPRGFWHINRPIVEEQ